MSLAKIGLVYCYYNTVTHKRYIGFTGHEKDRRGRWNSWTGVNGYTKGVDEDRRKYPKELWEYSVLERDCDSEREKYWISFYKSDNPEYGYNVAHGGAYGRRGLHHTQETKELIRTQKIGKKLGPFTEEHRLRISLSNKGKAGHKHNEAERRHQSAQISGRHHMNNSIVSVMVKDEDVQTYLNKGFVFGRLKK